MKTPTINSRILKLEVLKGTATRTSVNAVESRTASLESDVATAQGDISTLQTDVSAAEGNISTLQGNVATLTQGIVDAVSTHNTAPDAHADLRTLIAGRALTVHQHARTDLPWVTEPGAALLTAASASAQRTALGMTAWAVAPWTDGTTSDIPEGTQLYFTNARADARAALIVSAHNVAGDSHADIRTALAGKQDAGSYLTTTTNYAGSSSPGGAATTALACTGNAATATTAASCTGNSATATTASSCSGNAATATKLATPRTLTIGAAERTVDGTSNVSFTLGDIGLGSSNNVSFASMSLSSSALDFVGKFTNTAYAYAGAFGGHLGCYSTYGVDGTPKGDLGTLNTLVSGGSVNDFGVFVRGDNKVVLGTNDSPRVEASSAGIRTITPPSGRSSSPAWRLGDVADGYAYVEIGGATFKFAVLPP